MRTPKYLKVSIPAQVECHSKETECDGQIFFYVRLSWLGLSINLFRPVINTINVKLQVTI